MAVVAGLIRAKFTPIADTAPLESAVALMTPTAERSSIPYGAIRLHGQRMRTQSQ